MSNFLAAATLANPNPIKSSKNLVSSLSFSPTKVAFFIA
ncbi:hypothetical protein V6Z11_D02G227900 [Gossypium hirsutum]